MNQRPTFLNRDPVELKFGTSGLRGLVVDMTDLEVYINAQGFLRYLVAEERVAPGAPVVLGRDLRSHDPTSGLVSSPRIAAAAALAIRDLGHPVINVGTLPTPALASYALAGGPSGGPPLAAMMVTGSHIPANRNGVKFYQPSGEVLKSDEAGILNAVRSVRADQYSRSAEESIFGPDGQLKSPVDVGEETPEGIRRYADRYLAPFVAQSESIEPLAGLRVVVYQHSSVARDLLVEILGGLGAAVVPTDRVDHFVAVDTEDVTVDDEAKYRKLVLRHAADALVSTDGDGDRPLVVDERGRFHRGDVLGIVCAEYLEATFAAVPVSATDAIERHLTGLDVQRTRIGSPYVIEAMNAAITGGHRRIVGWEANGGFLTATPFALNGQPMAPLPTRDAVLPILAVLLTSVTRRASVSALFAGLPARATRAGLLDDFAPDRSQALLTRVRPADASITGVRFGDEISVHRDGRWVPTEEASVAGVKTVIGQYFGPSLGLGEVVELNLVDGVRIYFDGGQIIHLRPSGNAPQFRVYTVADDQATADALVEAAIAEPHGVLRTMERDLLGA